MKRLLTFLSVVAISLSGCSLFRANPLDERRGAIILVFDTSSAGDLKSLRKMLDQYNAKATFFVSGQISRGTAGQLYNFLDEGHEVGLSGLRGTDAQSYTAMYGMQKYFQDEIVPQVLDARRYGVNVRYCMIGPLTRAKPNPVELTSFIASKGFSRVVHKMPNFVPVEALPVSRLKGSVLHANHLTEKNFVSAQIAALSSSNEILLVYPDRKILPELLKEAKEQGVPFAKLSDLPG